MMTMNTTAQPTAPKEWRGRFLEDFEAGDVFRSRLGRTVTDTDNIWFTTVTMNTNAMHFNAEYAERTRFGQMLVNSCFTLSLVTGLSVPDTSENGTANLAWTDIKLPKPVYVGDTIWAETEVLSVRRSKSKPTTGVIGIRTRGVNQRGEVVIEFKRTFMVYSRDAEEATPVFPDVQDDWQVA